jgi:hypothetical protein
MHKRMDYWKIWTHFELKLLLDALITVGLFIVALSHLMRFQLYLPQSMIGEYRLIAAEALQQNAQELHLENLRGDVVYDNKFFDEEDDYGQPMYDPSFFDIVFCISDFVVQFGVLLICFGNIMTKEGYVDLMHPDYDLYSYLKVHGLSKNINLIALFTIAHMNMSKFTGTSFLDSLQYTIQRFMPVTVFFLLMWRSDYSGTLKYNFEILMLVIAYTMYLIFSDWSTSRVNQLAQYSEGAFLLNNDLGFEAEYAEKKKDRIVLLFYRPDGKGGIQGIVIESFYINRDGRIANEFYLIKDCEDGQMEKLESETIRQLKDGA